MAQEFNAFSVATKGYACGLGTTGFFAFAIATKGLICDAEEEEVLRGGDSSKLGLYDKRYIDVDNEAITTIVMTLSRKRRR